ncbi:alpha-1,3-fucosyltransferase [Bacteroidia bacterium]|nr:alpha-1,3-fucosyltransferase [Bacteroidia bacterium]GHV40327.1 alpha-1,3-fucosyltransferase [Bacteroidia bacterium]
MDNIANILPEDVQITYDRSLLPVADAVVFNIPFLPSDLEGDIEKPDNQLWIGWSYESEANYPWMFSDELKDLFDLWMTYHLDSDIVLPYYDYSFLDKLYSPVSKKTKDICMFVSSPVNNSKRIEYLSELMKYLDIDSYGRWQRNRFVEVDLGYTTKLDIIKQYKFTIAFENAISEDYVTEKFFDPLIMGSVPVYLGASNIEQFSPGENSFVDVRKYNSPELLAERLKEYCQDNSLYDTLLEWRKHPLKCGLKSLIEDQKKHPFERLVNLIHLFWNKNKPSF